MEAPMQKVLTSLAASAALVLFVSSAQAECAFHNQETTASVGQEGPSVAMSTYDPAPVPTIAEEATQQAALPECPGDAKDCVPANK
jgi:hypothetical protein